MRCGKKKNCPLCQHRDLILAGVCAAAALMAIGAAIACIMRRRKKAQLEPLIFEPPIQTVRPPEKPEQPAPTEE